MTQATGDDIQGQCHCGRVRVTLRLSCRPEDIELRACECSFCRRHGTKTFADPRGHALIEAPTPELLYRYRFGLKTADYLLCAACGVYIGAVLDSGGAQLATINAAGLDLQIFQNHAVKPADYSAENFAERLRRRLAAWMPAEINFANVEHEQAVH
jgi:hypothetical protein